MDGCRPPHVDNRHQNPAWMQLYIMLLANRLDNWRSPDVSLEDVRNAFEELAEMAADCADLAYGVAEARDE